jgi:uncharacterized membrane protein
LVPAGRRLPRSFCLGDVALIVAVGGHPKGRVAVRFVPIKQESHVADGCAELFVVIRFLVSRKVLTSLNGFFGQI